jgi:hypothetical protein
VRDDVGVFEESPWKRTDEASWKFREDNLWGPRIAPLSKLVDALRRETGGHVPWIDPFCAGIEAQILAVLLRPGPLGAMATNFLSLANQDQTAKNTIEVLTQANISYRQLLFWNAIPWSGQREEKITSAMIQRGASMFDRLLQLLPVLRCVILVGGDAQRIETFVNWPPAVRPLKCAHPGPFVWNQHRYRHQKQQIFEVFRDAAALVNHPT